MKLERTHFLSIAAPVALACLLSAQKPERKPGEPAPAASTTSVDAARATLEKWVEVRRLISQEKRDWALGKELLTDRAEVVKREAGNLRGKINEAEQSIAEADKKKAELVAENEALKSATTGLASTMSTLEQQTLTLVRALPPAVAERVKPLVQSIPEKSETTKQSLGQRFQNVIGTLNELNKAHREIAMVSEVRTVGDAEVEVTTLYVGLAQAFYLGGAGKVAGVGEPSPNGWTWRPNNELAPQIAHAIAIVKNEKVAEFVALPVKVQ